MKRVLAVVSFEVVDFTVEDKAAPRYPLPDAAGYRAEVGGVVLRRGDSKDCTKQTN